MGVVGDSMIGAGILPGGWIIVDRSAEPVNGSIVVALIDGELTVKYYIRTTDSCFLIPANPMYQDIQINEVTEFVVWGVVIHAIATESRLIIFRLFNSCLNHSGTGEPLSLPGQAPMCSKIK